MVSQNVIYGLYCVCPSCEEYAPHKIRYVGQTQVGIAQRFSGHLKPSQLNMRYPVCRWKKKHGPENIRYEILEELSDPAGLDVAEMRWVERMGTFTDWNLGGLNFTKGGRSSLSIEARGKISEANSRDTVPWAKLGRKQARKMRDDYQAGKSVAVIAAETGVAKSHAYDVIGNKVWADPSYAYKVVDRGPKPLCDRVSFKVSREDAYDMRQRYSSGDITQLELAKEYGVSVALIGQIIRNEKHVDPSYHYERHLGSRQKENISKALKGVPKPQGHGKKVSEGVRGANHGMAKLDESKVVEIRKMRRNGTPSKEIAEIFGVNRNQVNRICSGVRWGHVREGLD